VVRRDNNQCQNCGQVLKDNEIEFDHIIPVSKGGSSEEQNVRVSCFDCNRSKSDKYQP
jgi:5-methylcytosine-specific restriction endonuclease McrA